MIIIGCDYHPAFQQIAISEDVKRKSKTSGREKKALARMRKL